MRNNQLTIRYRRSVVRCADGNTERSSLVKCLNERKITESAASTASSPASALEVFMHLFLE